MDIIGLNKHVNRTMILKGLKELGITPKYPELVSYLDELLKTGIIVATEPFNPTAKMNLKNRTKSELSNSSNNIAKNLEYKIQDELVIFNYYWLIGKQKNLSLKWNPNDPMHNEWKGKLFELICFKHFDLIEQFKKYQFQDNYSKHFWTTKETDIDLLVDRDSAIDIFEMKCYDNGYKVEETYFNILNNKREFLLRHIQSFKNQKNKKYNKKSVFINLITSSEFIVDKNFLGTEKIAVVIKFTDLF